MKKVLIMLERWILPLLVFLVLVLFSLSVHEKMVADAAMTAFKAAVQALTLDSPEDGFTLYMNFSIKVTLAWAAVKVYMASVGLKWDNIMARRLTRNHIVIAAGSRDENNEDDQSPRSKLALAIDLAYSLAPTETIVLTAPEIDEVQRTKLRRRHGLIQFTFDFCRNSAHNPGPARRFSVSASSLLRVWCNKFTKYDGH